MSYKHAPSSSSHRVKGFAVLLTMSVDFILDRLAEVPEQQGCSVDTHAEEKEYDPEQKRVRERLDRLHNDRHLDDEPQQPQEAQQT